MSAVVYLIHLERKLAHSQHYLGCTADLSRRLQQHRSGLGSPFLRAASQAGIEWHLVRLWEGGFELERRLKRRKCHRIFCPVCSGQLADAELAAVEDSIIEGAYAAWAEALPW